MAQFVLKSTPSSSVSIRPPFTLAEEEEKEEEENESKAESSSFEVEEISMEEDDPIAAAGVHSKVISGGRVAVQRANKLYSLAPNVNSRPPPELAGSTTSLGPRQLSSTSLPNSPTSSRKSRSVLPDQRHYKKDSRFVLDLYTLTFDEDETVDDVETRASCACAGAGDLAGEVGLPSLSLSVATNDSSGPLSLQSARSQTVVTLPSSSVTPTTQTLPSLETNLHKILARKIQDSEEMTFRKAKLLTKAYYKLLRESTTPLVDPQVQVLQQRSQHQQMYSGVRQSGAGASFGARRIGEGRLSWQELLRQDPAELRRIVAGVGNTVRALNDYLVELLQERDDLLGQQDDMLEEISELTDSFL